MVVSYVGTPPLLLQATYEAKNAIKSTLGLFIRDRHIDVLATWTCWKSLASRSEDVSTVIVTRGFHVAKEDESGDIPGKGPCGIWGNIYTSLSGLSTLGVTHNGRKPFISR